VAIVTLMLMGSIAAGRAVAGESRLPAVPYPLRDVGLVENGEFTRPHVPPLRTSADGRVGLHSKMLDGMLRFHLIVPEYLDRSFGDSEPGIGMLDDLQPFAMAESRFRGGGAPLTDHVTLCDPTPEHPRAGESPSPYGCGTLLRDDCYDLTVVASTRIDSILPMKRLWGVPITVRVSDPKTAGASIADVVVGEPVEGAIVPGQFLLEVAVTNDGHLIVARIDTPEFVWRNPSGSDQRSHFVDIVYSFYPGGADPCDVAQWRQWYPISHAPYDLRINNLYGFAVHPFRDAEGALIPDGADLKASYPWIDRRGANLFFTIVGETLVRDEDDEFFPLLDPRAATYYPARCLTPGCPDVQETRQPTRGHSVMGLWTHGKMVQLDGILNNTDWSLMVADDGHRMVELYEDGAPERRRVEVRVGSGRDTGEVGHPLASAHNLAIFDSLENLFHAHPPLFPATSRDVVWIASNGKASDEIAFDDFINPDSFVISEMVAATSFEHDDIRRSLLRYGGRPLTGPVRIQNAATAPADRWHVPAAGVGFGAARVEPVALGGVRGRGLWVDGSSGVRYAIPPQPRDVAGTPWYVGVFLNVHIEDDGVERILYGFPGGERVAIAGRSEIRFRDAHGDEVHAVALPTRLERDAWSHLGVQFLPGDARVLVYHDGFLLEEWQWAEPLVPTASGELYVGGHPDAPGDGVVGWIDEFKIVAQDVGAEVACNHARGTLTEVPLAADDPRAASWKVLSERYPDDAHERIAEVAGVQSTGVYLCFHGDVGGDRAAEGVVPASLRRVREALTFPEGPLLFGEPRPDSSANPFCLSCHTATGWRGLSLGALSFRPDLPSQDDPRRQPSQPLRRVFGNIPAHWLGTGKPPSSVLAPPRGVGIDALLASVDVPVPTPAPTPAIPNHCPGDCNGDGRTTVAELVAAVSIALGRAPGERCAAGYPCQSSLGCVGIAQLVRAVGAALNGC